MERTLRDWRERVEMDLSGGRSFLLSTTGPAKNPSSSLMKIKSDAGSQPATSFDLCSLAGCGCFVAAHQVKPPDGFCQIGVFGLLAMQVGVKSSHTYSVI
ncbi:hypothetical protein AVEN_180814-1 [Araneus ventricosus]|uniref:Uncharacterized protein n=1 Tax=Araneus ventricosus TaxID=182803 RepID=A0A4Y2P7K2_ARAVE|nr:hypothetical protein AVEN_180814-1 [Araneus ventricosus]